MSESSRITLPTICRTLGIGRATAERLLVQYEERLPKPERAGIIRIWPREVIDDLRVIVQEEQRLQGAGW